MSIYEPYCCSKCTLADEIEEDLAYSMNYEYDAAELDLAYSLNMLLTEALVFNPRLTVPNYVTGDFWLSTSTYIVSLIHPR